MKSSDNPLDKANFQSTYAAMFFGVPNQGMDISSLIPLAEGQDNLPFLTNLGNDSELLHDLNWDFCLKFDFKDSIIISYYETERSPTAERVSYLN
jgi:protein SERAC1